jgi:hypothetical protein
MHVLENLQIVLQSTTRTRLVHQVDSTDAEVIQPKEEKGRVRKFGPTVANEKLSTDDV